jgi:hypothetical protein
LSGACAFIEVAKASSDATMVSETTPKRKVCRKSKPRRPKPLILFDQRLIGKKGHRYGTVEAPPVQHHAGLSE